MNRKSEDNKFRSSTIADGNSLLQSWREEQHDIASHVVVPESSATYYQAIVAQSERDAHSSSYYKEQTDKKKYLLVGGVDVSFPAEEAKDAVAVYVILQYDISTSSNDDKGIMLSSPHQPKIVYRSHKYYKPTTPYVPSYLAFREIDPLLELIMQQRKNKPCLSPNVIMVDGNGQWHERGAGIACFVGVKTGIPTVGVGKSFYCLDEGMTKSDIEGDVKKSVCCWYSSASAQCIESGLPLATSDEGCRSLIVADNVDLGKSEVQHHSDTSTAYEDILIKLHQNHTGLAVPMRSNVNNEDTILAYALVGHGGNNTTNSSSKKKSDTARGSKNPIYISCGSQISLLEAVSLVACIAIARIPEPIREADLYGRQLLRDGKK